MPRPFILSAIFIVPAPLHTQAVQLVWKTGSKNRTLLNSSDCKLLRVGTYETKGDLVFVYVRDRVLNAALKDNVLLRLCNLASPV